ncbi:hypothetical protein [Microbacterium soli]|uniref:Integral membrane protein n=1 Tax=Microbacterium soli TaxID=446075 RepID=A0ABP7MLJ3_9MICO
MEQTPAQGAAPLDPPSAAVAQAYLDESARVTERRETWIDRRAAARLMLAEGVGLGVYLVVLMLVFAPAEGSNVAMLLVPFLIWTRLAMTLREEYGYQRRGREQRARTIAVIIIVVMIVGALSTLVLDVDIPFAVRFIPGVTTFGLFGALAWGEWRRASGESVSRTPPSLDRSSRLVTIGIGLGLGATIPCITAPGEIVSLLVSMAVMLALVVWMLVETAGAGSHVALAWGPYLWGCFVAAAVVTVVLLVLVQFTVLPLLVPGLLAGAVIAAAFAAGALRRTPDA